MSSSEHENHIGTLSESTLHSQLKEEYARDGDLIEASVGNFVADILRGGHIIEIQIKNLAALQNKLEELAKRYTITIVHPIAKEKWIVRESMDRSEVLSRRKSPKKQNVFNLFEELVHAPLLLGIRGLDLEVVLIQEEEIWVNDTKGSWKRKGWSIVDRQMLDIVERYRFEEKEDLLALIPDGLDMPFTNKQLAKALGIKNRIAQKVTYTLRKMNLIQVSGKKGRAFLHRIAPNR
ncbi:hypothetical protein EU537_12620 [Candidatus Thorarchaeota archaeon]|nr:MAG: hypothetical protein EU537_12620 [Candidatus Thorarchaeota archaeon]